MLIQGAERRNMGHKECLCLIEKVEDTHNHLISLLTFLISSEGKRQSPRSLLIAEWEMILQKSIDLESSLPGSDISVYEHALYDFRDNIAQLEPVAKKFFVSP